MQTSWRKHTGLDFGQIWHHVVRSDKISHNSLGAGEASCDDQSLFSLQSAGAIEKSPLLQNKWDPNLWGLSVMYPSTCWALSEETARIFLKFFRINEQNQFTDFPYSEQISMSTIKPPNSQTQSGYPGAFTSRIVVVFVVVCSFCVLCIFSIALRNNNYISFVCSSVS